MDEFKTSNDELEFRRLTKTVWNRRWLVLASRSTFRPRRPSV